MAFTYLDDATVALGGLDLTTQSNKVAISIVYDELENTTFRSGGARSYQAGLADTDISVEGYFYAGSDGATPSYTYPDPVLFNELTSSVTGTPLTIASNEVVGSTCYLTLSQEFNYKILGNVGELAPFSMSAKGNQPVARGITLTDPDVLTTGSFTPAALTAYSALAAGKTMYANLHLLALSSNTVGATVQVNVVSNTTTSTTGTTTRFNFPAMTDVGAQQLTLSTPVTQTNWGVVITATGTNTRYKALVSIGIV